MDWIFSSQSKANKLLFFLIEVSYSYMQPFFICNLVKVAISYGFSKMDGKSRVSLWAVAAGSDMLAQYKF